MKTAIALIALALPLAACGSKTQIEEKNASVEQVAKSVREAAGSNEFIKPGEWESTVTIEDISMPGMPAGAAAKMKNMVASGRTTTTCVSPEEVKKPDPDFFAGNDKCRYDHFKMGSGTIDAEMHCTQEGRTQVMQMNGNYSPDTYTMHMTSKAEGAGEGPGANMTMKMKVEAKRVGECTARES